MSNKYLWGRTKRLWYLGLLLVASLFSQNAWAQVSAYSFSSSTTTYTPITGGTALTTASFDDNVYTNQPIGFSFVYNGTTYTAFGVNANGWISMGAAAPANSTTAISSGTTNNVIAAYNRDLISGQHVVVSAASGSNTLTATNIGALAVGNALSTAYAGMAIGTTVTAISGTGPYTITMSANATSTTSGTVARFDSATAGANPSEIRYETIGTAPNRTLVVQFKNVRRYYGTPSVANSGDVLNFQIRLNETTNTVEVVYGSFFTTGTTSNTAQVGLRGASSADYNNRTATTSWSTTSAGGSNAATMTFSNTVAPASGTQYVWTAPNCLAPSAIVVSLTGTTSANFSWTAPSSVPSVGYEYFVSTSSTTPSTAANTGTATATTTGSASSLTPSTTYYVFVRSECTTDTEYSTWTTATSFFTGYCNPAPVSVDGTGITNVSFSGVNNSTSTETNNYGNYTGLTGGSFAAGTTATVDITYSTAYTYGTIIWVDWNNDLDFTDSGEQVYYGLSTSASPTTLNASFSISALTTPGNYRMRIGGTDADAGPSSPCYTGSYGTFEDYTLEVTAAPSCLPPTAPAVASITNATATVSWTAPVSAPSNGYNLYVSTTNTAPTGSETYDNPSGVSFGLTSLTGNTTYYWWVRSDCGSSTYSVWLSGGSFTTACDPATTFSEGFESTSGSLLPSCWTGFAGSGGSGYTQASTGIAGARNVYAYWNYVLAAPPVSNLGDGTHRLRFKQRANFTVGQAIEVGYLTDPNNAASFVAFSSITTSSATVATEETILFGTAPGSAQRIAFRVGSTPGYSVLLDDIIWEEIPSCLEPTALSSVGATTSTIDFQWTASASDPSNGYDWEVRTSGAAGSGATGLADFGSEGYGITAASADGLSANTTYSIYVRANCGAGGYSAWTTALTVFTGYCTPAPTSVDDEGITNVTFSGVNNTTSTESGNYGDYTALTGGSFAASTLATVNITYTTGYTYDTKIWVDWNNDLDFTDSGEEVYTGTSTSASPTTLVATFTIPAPTTVGSYRMRIGGLDSGPATPCYTGSYGTFEDYTLVVTAAPSCLAPTAPSSGTLTSVGATVSWTAASPAPANGYDLYVSTTNTAPTGSESYIDVTGVSQVLNTLSSNTTYYWWVRSDCGAGDYSPWLTGGSFTTLCETVSTFPFNETFEAASATRGCWAVNDYVSGTANWVYAAGSTSVLTTAQQGSLNARFYSANYSGNTTRLVSPSLDLTSLTTPRVSFYYAMPDWGGDQDELRVYYKTSAAGSWTLITGAEFTTSTTSWTQATFALPSPSSDYYLAFEGYSGYGYGAVLDNVVVEETPSCLEPTDLAVSSVTNNSASLSWTGSTSDPSNGYEWEVRSSGAAGSGATGLDASGTTGYGVVTASATGLTASTDYSVYVRSNCGSSYSAWTAAATFTTLCDPATLPYTETFDPTSTTRGCWLSNDNNGDFVSDWLLGDIYAWLLYWDGVDATNEFAGIYTSSTDNDDYLISPALPLTGNEWVTYDVYSSVASGGTGYEVLLSTTGTDPADFTTTVLSVTTPTNTTWENTYIDLTAYSGTVYLAWHIPSGVNGDESVYIDNVTVELMPACIPPTGVAVNGYATNWTASWSGASDVIIEYGPVGFTPGTDGTAGVGGTIVSGSGSSAAFTVAADAYYEMYVRANCTATADGYSTNAGPYTFNSYTVVPYSGSQTITTCAATISDHNGPTGDYSNGANGYLVIYPGTPGSVLNFTGTVVAENTWDYLRFYRGVGTSGSQLASFTGGTVGTPLNINIQSDQLDQPVTVSFSSDGSGIRPGFTFNVACASACGLEETIPAPLTTSASVCAGESFTLSLDIPAALGYSYQWYSSPGGGSPFVAISGATSSTYTGTQTAQTQYLCSVDCEYGDQLSSGIRTVFMNAPTSCYGVSSATSTADEDISAVSINGVVAPVSNTCGTNMYTDFTGTSSWSIARGTEGNSVSITVCDVASPYYYADVAVFIDLNQDGDFADSGESLYQAPSFLNLTTGTAVFNGTFTIPSTATLGQTRLRVVAQEQNTNVTINPTGTYFWGETEDYTVTIIPGVANDLFANATNVVNQSSYPSCSNVSGTLIGATDATAGVVGDDVFYKFTAQSSAYRISTSGASGDVTLELRDGTNTLISSGVVTAGGTGSNEVLVATGLTNNVVYYVRVINQSLTPANFSICIQKIVGSGCNYGPNYSNLCSNFKSTWTGANSYSVTFFDGTNLYTGGSTGTTLFTLASAVGDPGNVLAGGLRYNTTYSTSVTANYVLTDFNSNVLTTVSVPSSTPCSVIIGNQPNVALRASDRSASVGNNARAYGSFIACDPWLCATSEYLWRVTEIDPITEATISPIPVVIESNSTSRFLRINAATNTIFHTGGRYIVEVAPRFSAGHDGTYGTAYDLLIAGVAPGMTMEDAGTEVVLVDKINEGGVFASLYPNPNTGESVNLNIAGIESESVNISIMDASGRVVWSNRYVVDGALFTTVNFDRPLAAGMYMVEMVYNGQVMTQRMMVQK